MRRALLILLVVLVALPGAALLAGQALLDSDALKARITDAAFRATGRTLTVAGPVRLSWSLAPTITLRDVSFANPPGLSRPAMAHLDRVEAEVALLPLLSRRVEVRRLVLAGADVLLERDAAGRPNWTFAPASPSAAETPAAPAAPGPRMAVTLGEVDVRDARLGWSNAAGAVTVAAVPQLIVSPDSGRLAGSVRINDVALSLGGTIGAVAEGGRPLDLTLAGGGVAATVTGTDAHAAVVVLVPDLAAAAGVAGRPLPSVQAVRLAFTLAPGGVSGLELRAGAADLGSGVRLTRLSGVAAGLDQPLDGAGEAVAGALPFAVAAKAGTLASVLGGGPILLQLTAAAEGATLSASGSLAGPALAGSDLTVSLRVADLRRLGALAGVALPPLRDAALEVRLAGAPGALSLRGIRLTTPQGEVTGDLEVGTLPRPSLRGALLSQRLDLDAGPAAMPVASVPVPAAMPPASPSPAGTPPATAAADRLLPDTPLPFAALQRADGDLRVGAAEIVWHGATYRALEAHVSLQDGRLRLDPAGMQGPGGGVTAMLLADAVIEPPALALTVHAPGLAAGPVLAAFGAPEGSLGLIDVDTDLRARGRSPRALAATADGRLGLAMVDGEVENRWLAELFGPVLRGINVPVEMAGRSHVRCLAVRADAMHGPVRLSALALDTTRLRLDGEGSLDLASETLDLRLHPQVQLGRTGILLPLHVGGTFRAPKGALDPGALSPGRVGLTIGGPPAPDPCGPALALARGQAAVVPPTVPSGAPPGVPPAVGRIAKPADLLRSLLR